LTASKSLFKEVLEIIVSCSYGKFMKNKKEGETAKSRFSFLPKK